jgi:anti-sigma regulatory factor (Ser/Thr protein kinase)
MLPLAVLLAAALSIALVGPSGHFGLALVAVPFLAAAVHGTALTAAFGVLTVAVYASLRHVADEGTGDVWLIKIGLVSACSAVAVLMSQARLRQRALVRTRDVALTLQRGLLPHDFPDSNAVHFDYRYRPADTAAGVGGDWFDVIPLSGARVALVMGDVVGHGLHAAATMGRLRTAVNTLADLDLPPDELLARLDDLVLRMQREAHDDGGHEPVATCLYMVYDPVSRSCTMSGAGHPAPAFVTPDGRVEFGPLAQNPPLGVGGVPFTSTETVLTEGTVIALYTDGLLDLRRQESDAAQASLGRSLAPLGGGQHGRRGPRDLDAMCDRVWAELPEEHDDDAALMLVRTRSLDAGRVAVWDLPAHPSAVPTVRSAATRRLEEWGLGESAFSMELVISELLANAIQHGGAPVTLRLIREGALICEVSDGSSTSPHPRRAQPLEEDGRGLFLVGQLTDRWGTRYTPTGKTIWAQQYLAD